MRKYIMISVVSICLLWLILFHAENEKAQITGSSAKGTIRVFQSFGDFAFGKSSTFINLETGRQTRVRTNKRVQIDTFRADGMSLGIAHILVRDEEQNLYGYDTIREFDWQTGEDALLPINATDACMQDESRLEDIAFIKENRIGFVRKQDGTYKTGIYDMTKDKCCILESRETWDSIQWMDDGETFYMTYQDMYVGDLYKYNYKKKGDTYSVSGKEHILNQIIHFEVSKDGKFVCYTPSVASKKLLLYNLENGNEQAVIEAGRGKIYEFGFSPDGGYIYYVSGPVWGMMFEKSGLYLYCLESGKTELVCEGHYLSEPVWFPENVRLLFAEEQVERTERISRHIKVAVYITAILFAVCMLRGNGYLLPVADVYEHTLKWKRKKFYRLEDAAGIRRKKVGRMRHGAVTFLYSLRGDKLWKNRIMDVCFWDYRRALFVEEGYELPDTGEITAVILILNDGRREMTDDREIIKRIEGWKSTKQETISKQEGISLEMDQDSKWCGVYCCFGNAPAGKFFCNIIMCHDKIYLSENKVLQEGVLWHAEYAVSCSESDGDFYKSRLFRHS